MVRHKQIVSPVILHAAPNMTAARLRQRVLLDPAGVRAIVVAFPIEIELGPRTFGEIKRDERVRVNVVGGAMTSPESDHGLLPGIVSARTPIIVARNVAGSRRVRPAGCLHR